MAEIDHEALEAVQTDLEQLAKLSKAAEHELDVKRNQLYAPIFKKRQEVIAKIPNFWFTIMRTHGGLVQLTEEADIPILEHLTDIYVKHDEKDPRAYEIVFTFKENPYFKNKELIKKVSIKDDEPVGETFEIDWHEGKDVTVKDPNQKRKKGEDLSNISDSFFSWFRDDDTSIADVFAEEIFPGALEIYTGDDDEDFDDDEGSVDLGDEDDDDEDDEDDEEEEEKHQKKKSKK